MWICIAPRREHTSKALRYGTHFQGISQFYLHTPRSSANGMNHTAFAFPVKAGTHNNNNNPICKAPECQKTSVEGWKAELALIILMLITMRVMIMKERFIGGV